jgi:hypothetical protein
VNLMHTNSPQEKFRSLINIFKNIDLTKMHKRVEFSCTKCIVYVIREDTYS